MAFYTRLFVSVLVACALLAALDLVGLQVRGEAPPRIVWFWLEVATFAVAVASVAAGLSWLLLRLHRLLFSRLASRGPAWLRRVLDFALFGALWAASAAPLVWQLARDVEKRHGFLRNPWSQTLAPLLFPALLLVAFFGFVMVHAVGEERGPVGRTRFRLFDAFLVAFVCGCLVADARFLVRYYPLYHLTLTFLALTGAAMFTARRLGDFGLDTPGERRDHPMLNAASLVIAALSVGLVLEGPILQWPPHADAAMFHTTYLRRVASWLHGQSDWDKDGFARLFGEGDSNDHDPTINPLAVDHPADGIDQDGDGRDRTVAEDRALRARMTPRPAIPPGIPRVRRVLVITIDAFRADRLGADTPTGPLLPRLRALAGEGVNFTHAYSTTASTLTSFREMLAASYAARDSNASFLPRVRALGTHTCFIAPSLMLDYIRPLRLQFGTFDERIATASQTSGLDLLRWGVHLTQPTARATSDSIVSSFRRHGRESLLLWAHYYDLHQWHDLEVPGAESTRPDAERYDAVLRMIGGEISRVLDQLDAMGMLEGTAIFITGDHGEGLGDHHLRFHTEFVWESLTRVPLIMVLPGVGHRTIATPVSLVDLGPTIVTLLGGEWTSPTTGNLLSRLGPQAEASSPVFLTEDLHVGVVLDHWKLIFSGRSHRFRMFDLADDPGETRNVMDGEARRFGEMRALLALHVARSTFTPGPRVEER